MEVSGRLPHGCVELWRGERELGTRLEEDPLNLVSLECQIQTSQQS